MKKPYRIVMLGRQGAGKGTQCSKLAATMGIAHISTGDMLRAALKTGSSYGQLAGDFMERGELVPDSIILGIVEERLEAADCKELGFVLDGFPRTLAQAQALDQYLQPQGVKLVINLDVPKATVLERLSSRRVCTGCARVYSARKLLMVDSTCEDCGEAVIQRTDDEPDAIARRLEIYDELTAPLITWFNESHKLATVKGDDDFEVIAREIAKTVDSVES